MNRDLHEGADAYVRCSSFLALGIGCLPSIESIVIPELDVGVVIRVRRRRANRAGRRITRDGADDFQERDLAIRELFREVRKIGIVREHRERRLPQGVRKWVGVTRDHVRARGQQLPRHIHGQ